jgi:hypothetical protein
MVRWGESRTIWWVVERGEEERRWARVKPDQPVPRMRIRGFAGGEWEGEEDEDDCLERFDEVDVEDIGREHLEDGVEVEELRERVIGAIFLRMER